MKQEVAGNVREYLMYIAGEWTRSSSGETIEVRNPYDNSLYAIVQKGNNKDVKKAIDSAYSVKEKWGDTAPTERADYLYRLYDIMTSRKDELRDALIAESGSTYKKASVEVTATLRTVRAAAEEAQRVVGETILSDIRKISITIRHPAGVIAAITPFNYPLLLSMKKCLSALAVGDTVVLKPASATPITQLKVVELIDAIRLPSGVFNIVTGSGKTIGNELVTNAKLAHISFTGSYETGKRIAERAAKTLKRVTLELGGSDPLIILRDATLDYAVDTAVFGAFFHQGQVCISAKRIIVDEAIAADFVKRFVSRVKNLKVGDPRSADTDIGPLTTRAQLKRINAQVQDAIDKGATIQCGGRHENQLYWPTVITDVKRDMKIYREEVFGPVRPIIIVANENEAIEVANDTMYGLSSGVLTNDLNKAIIIAKKLECGMVHINDSPLHFEPRAPFGGAKCSGFGLEGGKYSTEDLTEIKWITIQIGGRNFPI
ncbi:MAG TPA: aldehyde dehydrogenase family protein [Candidatus Acidoferrum sp.]|nr:aldehyde dehydrogenase family protein [Candidatus Acidoferrum sp.]